LLLDFIKTKIFDGGLKAGLPFAIPNGVFDPLHDSSDPSNWLYRCHLANEVVPGLTCRGFVTSEKGLGPLGEPWRVI